MTDLVIPTTGELLDLNAPTDVIAAAFEHIAALEDELRRARATLRAELLDRMDRELARKHEAGSYRIECEAPDLQDYAPDELAPVLAVLAEEGKISERAMNAALERVVSFKPRKRELDKLLQSPALTDDDRDALRACAHPRARERRLTVKRLDAE